MKKLSLFFISFLIFFGRVQNVYAMEGQLNLSYPGYLLNAMHPGLWVSEDGDLRAHDSFYKEISKEQRMNFKSAADYLFRIPFEEFKKQSPQELEQIVINVHDLLVGDTEEKGYRNKGLMHVVTNNFTEATYKDYVEKLPPHVAELFTQRNVYLKRLAEFIAIAQSAQESGLSADQLVKLNEMHEGVVTLFYFDWWNKLSIEEKRHIQAAGFDYPPHWKQVPACMEWFTQHLPLLNRFIVDELPPLNELLGVVSTPDLMAEFIHTNLVNIHPFSEGNGSTARLIMNYIELNLGARPTIFFSDVKYKAAVKKSLAGDQIDFIKLLISERAKLHLLEEKRWFDKSRFCNACNTPALFNCSTCKVVSYCGVECQRKNWSSHKTHCKASS